MRNYRSNLIAVPAFILGCLATATFTTSAIANPPVSKRLAAWEYKVIGGGESEINSLARDGWEYWGESAAQTYGGVSIERKYTMRRQK